MKRILVLFLVLVLSISLFACADKESEEIETVVAQVETTQEVTTEAETTVAPTTVAPTTKAPATEAPTEKPARSSRSNKQILESGIWILYSSQDVVFDVYKFSNGVGECTSYMYANDQVVKNSDGATYVDYEINGGQVRILESTASYTTIWKFTGNSEYMTYSWQSYMGPEDGPIVTQKVYHRYELPSYEEAVKEKEEMWVR